MRSMVEASFEQARQGVEKFLTGGKRSPRARPRFAAAPRDIG
jgi:hypothetical protein